MRLFAPTKTFDKKNKKREKSECVPKLPTGYVRYTHIDTAAIDKLPETPPNIRV